MLRPFGPSTLLGPNLTQVKHLLLDGPKSYLTRLPDTFEKLPKFDWDHYTPDVPVHDNNFNISKVNKLNVKISMDNFMFTYNKL